MQVLQEMVGLGHWLRGSMHGFFQNPLDALLQHKRHPYTGHHSNYPTAPSGFRAEIPLWWSVSLNTVCYGLGAIARSGIRYNWEQYIYAADYDFHYQLSQHGSCASSSRITTITRHDSRSDGPANASQLQRESRRIREHIADQCGLSTFFDPSSRSLFLKLDFCHGTIFSQHLQVTPWLELREGLCRFYHAHNMWPG